MLRGATILDCSILLPGPYLGKLLAERGAKVLKVESPTRPDPARSMGSGAYYEDLNSCKTLVPLDLLSSSDRERFAELVKSADALIEGYRPETKTKLGLDAQTLHQINPKLVVASIVGFPQGHARANEPAHDLNFLAASGALSLYSDMPAIPMADLLAAYSGAISVTEALGEARQSGQGRSIEISIFETLLEAQSKLRSEYRKTGLLPHYGQTLVTGLHPCYRIYRAKDGRRIAVGAIEPKYWQQVTRILGLEKYQSDGMSTGERAKEVIQEVQAVFESKDWSHWEPLFKRARCCVDPVLDYSEVS